MNARLPRYCAVIILASAYCVCLPVSALAANFDFKPSLAVGEEFSDNIYEDPQGKQSEFTTLITPGFTSLYESSFWRWDAAYSLGYKHFANNSGVDEYNSNGDLKGKITVLDNFFYLDLSDRYQLIYTNIARDQTTQSSLNRDQTKQNTAIISPYLLWRLSEKNTLKTGYRYTDIRYWGEGSDNNQHSLFADLTHEVTSRFSISVGYKLTYEQITSGEQITSDHITTNEVYGGGRYVFAEKSSIFASVGNTWQKYSNGDSSTFVTWNAGIIQDFGTVLATVDTSSQTTEDPLTTSTTTTTTYRVKLDKELPRGAISLSGAYSEYKDAETNANNERKIAVTGSGRYEVTSGLTPNVTVTAEHYDKGVSVGTVAIDYSDHLLASAGLRYAFNYGLSMNLNYTYDTYRNAVDNTSGSTDINRVLLEMKKTF